ncbi:MAG: FAD-dependent oxidoreductase [Rhodospirillales bacterium]
MAEEVQVAIVGGGILGVSLLYHLAKSGWQDIVLLEKNELTAGSTWHAAGLCTHFAHNPTVMEMRATSVRLYRDVLPEELGRSVGFHACGALRVTRSPERLDEFRHVRGIGRFMGYDLRLLSPVELAEVYPLCTLDGVLGALHEPDDGHVDPSQATQGMAEMARARGAVLHRHRPVRTIRREAGAWRLETDQGDFLARHLVNAAGTWCREIGEMMGLDLPVVPMLHQYLVTDRVAALAERQQAGQPELPIIRDPEESWYLRQERDGFICGPYETAAPAWSVDGVPPDFGMELLPPDLERVEAIVALAMARVPALAEAGIKTVVNGPITFTPDANPLIGPAFGLPNAWLLTGSSMGVMEGGGAGAFLAHWMREGAPPLDALAVDGRRFGPYADRAYRLDKAKECFGLQFGIHYPFEERPAGRPRRITPLLSRQAAAGAVFGSAYGWERPNWFAREPGQEQASLTFRRPAWFDAVAGECRAVGEAVGLADLSAFAKFEVSGRGAAAFLEGLGCQGPPRRVGRLGLLHALTSAGGVASEFTVTRLADDRFYLTSAAAAERHDEDLLRGRSEPFPGVTVTNLTEETGILAVAGPKARALLAPLIDLSLSDADFPWLGARRGHIAGVPLLALRVSYVGELGWELHVPLTHLAAVYDVLTEAGGGQGLRPFGAYAMNALRLEKGYAAWGSDLTSERTPLEAGLAAYVRSQGRDFVGRDALLRRAEAGPGWRLVLLELPETADPFYLHPLYGGDALAGMVTSAAYGHRVGRSLALAYLRPDALGTHVEVEILGRRVAAEILPRPPYDPENDRPSGRHKGA